MEKIEITVIGAGVIGLSIANELSHTCQNIFVIEKHSSFGQEISSRNSEVIHGGIYYPERSLKCKTCIEGRNLIYEFCAKHKIRHRKIGKLIVAIDKSESGDLEKLFRQGALNGVNNLRLLSRNEIKSIEPHINAHAAIYSPATGIIDSHGFMKELVFQFNGRNGQIAYETEVIGIDKVKDGFEVTVTNKGEGTFKFFTHIVINAAGLNADKLSLICGIGSDEYRLKYAKGTYFRVGGGKNRFINRLIYPLPQESLAGLGIHATLDLAGNLRLGPDTEYVDNITYDVDISKRAIFYKSACRFLPFIKLEDIAPDMAGIRPKLQGPGEGFRDFLIKDETENGLSGFINLIGIESPGLTGSLSIARMIREIVKSLN